MANETQETKTSQIQEKVNALFAGIGKLTKVQRLLICLGTLVLVGGVYYYFIFMPKHAELKKVKAVHQTQVKKLADYKRKALSLGKFEKEMAAVQEKFDFAVRALPEKKELPSLLTGVSKAGSRAGLKFLLFQPEPVVNREFYKEIPLSMTVAGNYAQIADFFFQVAGLNRIVNIQNISMTSNKKSPGKVQMKCKAVTYMFVENVGDKAKGKNRKNKKG